MKTTSNLLMTVLAATAMFSSDITNADEWRGFVQVKTNQESKTPELQTTMTGFGGGQVGRFLGIGTHNVDQNLMVQGETIWADDSGDLLFLSYHGQIEITFTGPYVFSGNMAVVGGTGRYVQSRGSANIAGNIDPNLQQLEFEFEGDLYVPGNFEMEGSVVFDGLQGGQGQVVQYSMFDHTSVFDVLSHSGSLQPTTIPQIDDSDPAVTVISFEAKAGFNERLGQPMHVMRCENGDIYASVQAYVRIEIENQFGTATQTVDARFTALGGTRIFENLTGGWQATMSTKTSYGDGPVSGQFRFSGDIQLDTITDSGNGSAPSKEAVPADLQDTMVASRN